MAGREKAAFGGCPAGWHGEVGGSQSIAQKSLRFSCALIWSRSTSSLLRIISTASPADEMFFETVTIPLSGVVHRCVTDSNDTPARFRDDCRFVVGDPNFSINPLSIASNVRSEKLTVIKLISGQHKDNQQGHRGSASINFYPQASSASPKKMRSPS
jgi:hypothetical protein